MSRSDLDHVTSLQCRGDGGIYGCRGDHVIYFCYSYSKMSCFFLVIEVFLPLLFFSFRPFLCSNFNQIVGTYEELQAYLKEYVKELSRSDKRRNAL